MPVKRYPAGCVHVNDDGTREWGETVSARDYDALAADLAEARGLLRESRHWLDRGPHSSGLLPAIDAFLSRTEGK
jgi:hypothetical protein